MLVIVFDWGEGGFEFKFLHMIWIELAVVRKKKDSRMGGREAQDRKGGGEVER